MISLDGSYLEGGGQIVRTALAFSTLTKQAFEVTNIRRGRKDPGLKAQHVHCIKALEQIMNLEVKGAELGSTYLCFEPKKIIGNNIKIDIGTAGSITLLLQAVLLPCFFTDKKFSLTIKGGTNVAWSMPVEYLTNVLTPQIRKYCEKIDVSVEKRGYYPEGGGIVKIKLKNKYDIKDYLDFNSFSKEIQKEHTIQLTELGNLELIEGISHASISLQKKEVAERQMKTARHALSEFGVPVKIVSEYSNTLSTGSGITLWAKCSGMKNEFNPVIIGADALGELGKPAENVGEEAAKKLIQEIKQKAVVDTHMADNLIPWMGLFKPSAIKTSQISNHTLTNIFVVEKFLGKCFEIKENVIFSK